MSKQTEGLLLIPGAGVVGRGISLLPRQPYQLKQFIVPQDETRSYYAKETDQTYLLPISYEVNDSPPMPADQALNQTVIEESWERFDSQFSLDAKVASGNFLFSVDASAGQSKQMRSEAEAYYALRSSFIPLWTVYLPYVERLAKDALEVEVTSPFRHRHRAEYETFFERYGTHYVKRAWVGGKANLVFTIAKSSDMTKAEIHAGIQASYGVTTTQTQGASQSAEASKAKLQSSSECTVFGKGGNELALAALSSLDQERYNEWLATVSANPQVIELEVAGIWTLIDDAEIAATLQEAYVEATTFAPIMSMYMADEQVVFMRGDHYFVYNIKEHHSEKPRPIVQKWPFLKEIGFDRPDASFVGVDSFALQEENPAQKLIFFHRNNYIRIDLETNELDEGYPKPIAEGWPGVSFERMDAVAIDYPNAIYFFNGHEYVRFNLAENQVDDGYPALITQRWSGVTFDRIDAAMFWGNSKLYFFRGDQYIRYDMVTYRADPGYPKYVVGSYVEDWNFLE